MRQRRNVLLVNPRFQIKFSFYVVSWILALSMVYPMITHTLFDYFITFVKVNTPSSDVTTLEAVKTEFLRLLVLLHIVYIGVIFLISLFMSHKIAGPLYKLKKHIDLAKEGVYDVICKFRASDHFPELADDFNEMTKSFRERLVRTPEDSKKMGVESARAASEILEELLKKTEDSVSRDSIENALKEVRKIASA